MKKNLVQETWDIFVRDNIRPANPGHDLTDEDLEDAKAFFFNGAHLMFFLMKRVNDGMANPIISLQLKADISRELSEFQEMVEKRYREKERGA